MTHLIAFPSGWTKHTAQHFLLEWERIGLFTEIAPFIPGKLAQTGDVTLFSSGCSVGIGSVKLEVGLGCQVVDPGPPLKAVIPQDHGRVTLSHVLSHCLLQESNVELGLVGPGSALL